MSLLLCCTDSCHAEDLIFVAVISIIACYRGYSAAGGAKGVGEGTTRAVVPSSIAILILDYVVTFVSLSAD